MYFLYHIKKKSKNGHLFVYSVCLSLPTIWLLTEWILSNIFTATGDEVLSVNGTSFEGFTHQKALDTFKVIISYCKMWNFIVIMASLNFIIFEKQSTPNWLVQINSLEKGAIILLIIFTTYLVLLFDWGVNFSVCLHDKGCLMLKIAKSKQMNKRWLQIMH